MLRVSGLRAEVDGHVLVDGVSFELAAGEVLALVGASGSGKTTTGLALLGEHAPGVRITGEVRLAGTAAYVPQHPSSVLNPVRRVGSVLREVARRQVARAADGRRQEASGAQGWTGQRQQASGAQGWTRRQLAGGAQSWTRRRLAQAADERVVEAARRARLPVELLGRYPHQLSGGQQQRVVLAQALLPDPALIVADEPTTGQDGLLRSEVIEEFRRLRAQGIALVLLSHDLAMVRTLADRVAVLHAGRIVESGPAASVLDTPRHDYTRRLLAARPEPRAATGTGDVLLEVRDLVAAHRGGPPVLAGVSMSVPAGACLAVVGRSGSGKTTLARCVAGLHRPASGTIALDGRPLPGHLARRARDVQYVFQDARASFDPYRAVCAQVARTAVRLRGATTQEATAQAGSLLERVGLGEQTAGRRPSALSGGELQRAALARALLAGPRVLVCDEITSGLDALVQAAILDLLDELRRDLGLTLLLISHDMDVVARLADRVATLDDGRLAWDEIS